MRVENLIICSLSLRLGVEDKYGVNLGGRVKNRTLAMQIQEWDGNGVFGSQVLWAENEAQRSDF